MEIGPWPIVARAQLVQAFRPGADATNEAPFRTLRAHGWATRGIRVVTRTKDRASGRSTIFSNLNLDAARCARNGDRQNAEKFARAAEQLESTKMFAQLCDILTGKSAAQVSAIVSGDFAEKSQPEIATLLRLVARKTMSLRKQRAYALRTPEMVVGRILAASGDTLILEHAPGGAQTTLPRWLGHAAHREKVGDCLALVSEKLNESQLVVNAMPAIDIAATPDTFDPFGSSAKALSLTKADAALISGTPLPLRIMVPVTIES
jgi:hypothetical protein